MRVRIATDQGGFDLKREPISYLREAGHDVVDFGAHAVSPTDDYPDFVIPLAHAVARYGDLWQRRSRIGLRQQDFRPRAGLITITSRPSREWSMTT